MMTINDPSADIARLRTAFTKRDLSPVEWARKILERLDRDGDALNAFIIRHPEKFLAAARQSEARYLSGRVLGPLDGIPIGLKDLIETQDMLTTAGSKILADHLPAADAEIVRRLKSVGANCYLGKLNLHEFAYGTTGTSSYFGETKNPWQSNRMAGGSSSGAAVAVSKRWVLGAIGTDTGGSVRIPAALCGVTGLKPTYGRIPVAGVIPLSWSLDHVGPIARSAADVAELLTAIADPVPNASAACKETYRVLWPDNIGAIYDPAAGALITAALGELIGQRRIVLETGPLPEWESLLALQHIIIGAEASTFHWAWLKQRPDDYQPDVRTRLEARAALLAVQYIEALRARRRLIATYRQVFEQFDLVALPTVPITAPPLNETLIHTPEGNLEDVRVTLVKFTAPLNVLGLPAISHPVGFLAGLPVGLQWIAARNQENWLLDLVQTFQSTTAWHLQQPNA